MTVLLEIRDKMKMIYGKYEAFIFPAVKFLIAFVVLLTLNSKMGYMTKLDNIAIVLIVALMCSFLPTGCILLIAALISLLHMYALSMEVAIVGVCFYLIMYLVFFRFSPKESVLVLLTPLLFFMKIPYVIPLAAGLICAPASIVSVGCGVVVHYLLQAVIISAPNIKTMTDAETTVKIRMIVDSLLGNKEMLVVIAAFSVTIIVVYFLRRLSVNYAWTIAMIAGAMVNIVILLMGDLLYDINISVFGILAGSILALLVAKVIEFFRFCVDYSRTEKVQYEDDEYYYYVKAVPKMTVTAPTNTVKRINTQYGVEGERSYTTEHIRGNRGTSVDKGRGYVDNDYLGGKSVTVGNVYRDEDRYQDDDMTDLADAEEFDDYEELF